MNEKKKITNVLKDIFPYIIILFIVLFIKAFVVSPIRVNGNSMYQTLHDGDIMILNEVHYRFSDIERFDIVVIRHDDEYLIKRVIGLPGEKIQYKDNQLYVNGKKVKENFFHAETEDVEEAVVPKGEYFVLGDNRVNSMDSRYFGTFDKKDIKGKAEIVLFPFKRFGIK